MMNIRISVIILTYNRIEKLKRCLKSILSQEYDKKKYEIIAINDASSDNTDFIVSSLMKQHNNIRLITNKTNKGPAYCRNRGIKKAKGKIIAFTDDDCVAHKHWLSQIEVSHKKNPEELAIGGKILSLNSKSLISKFRDFQILYLLKRNIVKKNHFTYLPTCNVSYKKETFKKIGYFDESLKTAEDIDFHMRLLKINKPIYLQSKIVIFHDYPNSIKNFIKKSYSYGLYIPLLKKRFPNIKSIVPLNLFSSIIFLIVPFVSISIKFFLIKGLNNKIKLLPFITLDDFTYRIGVFVGSFKYCPNWRSQEDK